MVKSGVNAGGTNYPGRIETAEVESGRVAIRPREGAEQVALAARLRAETTLDGGVDRLGHLNRLLNRLEAWREEINTKSRRLRCMPSWTDGATRRSLG